MDNDNGSTKSVRIERTLDAPVDVVWRLWTEPDQFAAWYGPTGASIPVSEIDLQVGGSRKLCMEMQTPNGPMQMWFIGEYREIIQNQRLVYTEALSDSEGNALPPSAMGMPDDHPMETEVRVVLEDVGGKTKMVMTHEGVPAESPGGAGWAMAIDKLEAHLAAA